MFMFQIQRRKSSLGLEKARKMVNRLLLIRAGAGNHLIGESLYREEILILWLEVIQGKVNNSVTS